MAPAPAHSATRASSRRRERADRARRTDEVLAQLDRLDPERDRRRREELLEELIEINICVAHSIAARYRQRGISDEDLEQVACLALVRVARAYDHSSGYDFMSYAVPSVRGEVRRYFRDQGWMVRPPRRVQEMQGRISAGEAELTMRLGRPPTTEELASELDGSPEEVQEAQTANGCFAPTSLDQAVNATETSSIGEQLGHEEGALDAVEARVVLAPLVRRLSERERLILDMRFFRDCTQQEIADEIGVTQMQVSRLLSSMLGRMRACLEPGQSMSA
jgi:RNA polymerase sigma-B factor